MLKNVEAFVQSYPDLIEFTYSVLGPSKSYYHSDPAVSSCMEYVLKLSSELQHNRNLKGFNQIRTKLMATKKRWLKQVESYYEKNNSTKYVLREFKNLQAVQKYNDIPVVVKPVEELYQERIRELEEWLSDEGLLLHTFPYADDLQVNQRKLAIEIDTSYLLLSEADAAIFDAAISHLSQIDKNDIKYKSSAGGQMPEVLVSLDGIFRVSKPREDQITMFDGEYNISLSNESSPMKYTLTVPLDAITTEKTYLTAYDQKILVAVLQLGRKQIQQSNKITFSIKEVLDLLGLSTGGKNYLLVEKYLYNLHYFRHRIEYLDESGSPRIITYVIFQSIDKPKEDDIDEEGHKQWTVTLNSDLHNQILERNAIDVFAEDLVELKSETAVILLPYLASERLKSFRRVNNRGKLIVSGTKLIDKVGLGNNTIGKLLNKIKDALEELKSKSFYIKDFSFSGKRKKTIIELTFLEN